MKHCCHCGLNTQIKKFRAGKLGIFGGILIVGHLLFHVAECLVLPAFIMAMHGNVAEAAELETNNIIETAEPLEYDALKNLRIDFYQSMEEYSVLTHRSIN